MLINGTASPYHMDGNNGSAYPFIKQYWLNNVSWPVILSSRSDWLNNIRQPMLRAGQYCPHINVVTPMLLTLASTHDISARMVFPVLPLLREV